MVSLLLRLTFILLVVLSPAVRAQQFRVDTLARSPQMQFPTSIAFVPRGDGAFFFGEKNSGRVRVYQGGIRPDPFVTLPVDDEGEQGLLGVAIHPQYPDSPYVYVYYVRAVDRANVLERYEDQKGVGTSPLQMLFIPRRDEATGNNGGKMAFGPDEKLYVAVGDHGVRPSNAQDTLGGRNLRGKILRLNPDGSIPTDNILPLRYFWALGVRDPGGLTFDPSTQDLIMTEGGTLHQNEIITVPPGSNLGWPARRVSLTGDHAPPKILYGFGRGEQPALTGVAVYRGDAFPGLRGSVLITGNAIPALWAGRLNPLTDSLEIEPVYRSNTGFADVQVGPDGLIYLAVGPYLGSRILRLSPIPPAFLGDPPGQATQGSEYTYAPSWSGTFPDLEVLTAPAGMTLDSATGTLRWTPTNAQALEGYHPVVLRAKNGAGWTDRRFSIAVHNVNDPPSPFRLAAPANGSELRFLGEDPTVTFSWTRTGDPDGDSLRYLLELDTVSTFDSPVRIEVKTGNVDSARIKLPALSRAYLWRVTASDGLLSTANSPGPGPPQRRRFAISCAGKGATPRDGARAELSQSL